MPDYGALLRFTRKKAGLTQADLVNLVGKDRLTIHELIGYERGRVPLTKSVYDELIGHIEAHEKAA